MRRKSLRRNHLTRRRSGQRNILGNVSSPYSRRLRIEPLEDRSLLSAVSWDGGGNGASWTDPLNWSGNSLPSSGDDVTINAPGAVSVSLFSGSQTIHSLTIASDDALTQFNTGSLTVLSASTIAGSLTISGASGGVTLGDTTSIASLSISNGALSGAGDLTVTTSMNWSGGAMTGTGKTIISPAGSLGISSVSSSAPELKRVLDNDGQTIWSGGTWKFTDGTFNNNGTLQIVGSKAANTISSGINAFVNSGLLLNNSTALVQFLGGLSFNNTGTISGQGVHLYGGGCFAPSSVFAGDVSLRGGMFVFDNTATVNATLNFVTPITVDAPMTFLGSGAVNIYDNLSGAADVTFHTAVNWVSGTISGAGKLLVASDATFTINNNINFYMSRFLENDGNLIWSKGNLSLVDGTIQNNGTFTSSQATGLLGMSSSNGIGVFNNAGLFVNSGAAHVLVNGAQMAFNSSGMVDAGAGQIELVTSSAFASTATFAGMVTLEGGPVVFTDTITLSGTLLIATSFVVDSPLAFKGSGVVILKSSISGNGNVTFYATLNWVSGTMSGTGKTIIPSGSQLLLSGSSSHGLRRVLENDGSAVWSGGAITMLNGTFQNNGSMQTGAGGFNLSSSGLGGVNAFNNAGSFTNPINVPVSFGFSSGGSGVAFNNTGVVDGGSGQFNIDAGGTYGAGATFAGTISMGAFSTVGVNAFVGPIIVNGTLFVYTSISINSDVNFSGSGSFNLAGTLSGGANAIFSTTLAWIGGTMSGTGKTIIGPTGTLEIRNDVQHNLGRYIQNDGLTKWFDGLVEMTAATFQNNGAFEVRLTQSGNADTLTSSASGSEFNNAGVFTNNGTFSTTVYVPFNNAGTVDGKTARLYLVSGTHAPSAIFAGAITLGSPITGNGTHVFSSAVTVSGTLTVYGLIDIETPTTFSGAGNVVLLGAIAGSGDVTFAVPIEWQSGTMSGAGKTIISPVGFLKMTATQFPPFYHTLNRVLQNDGTVLWTNNPLPINGGALQNNGVFTIDSALALGVTTTGSATFTNTGAVIKRGVGALTFGPGVVVVNSGSIDVQAGKFLASAISVDGSTSTLSDTDDGALSLIGNLLGSTTNSDVFANLQVSFFSGAGTAAAPQLLEASSQDAGNVDAGFIHNFAFPTLSLTGTTYVKLVDQSDNAAGADPEAVYVDTLIVPAGVTLDLNGLHLYVRHSQIAGDILGGQVTQPVSEMLQVLVSSTSWTSAFLNQMQTAGLGSGGYVLSGNGVDSLAPLPWRNLDQIKVAFHQDVNVQSDSLSITSATSGIIVPVHFDFDSLAHIATWTLAHPVGNDSITLSLASSEPAAVTDGAGATVEGDFDVNFNVLPGDVTQDGVVDIQDITKVANYWLKSSPRSDANGDGVVDIQEMTLIANNWLKTNSGAGGGGGAEANVALTGGSGSIEGAFTTGVETTPMNTSTMASVPLTVAVEVAGGLAPDALLPPSNTIAIQDVPTAPTSALPPVIEHQLAISSARSQGPLSRVLSIDGALIFEVETVVVRTPIAKNSATYDRPASLAAAAVDKLLATANIDSLCNRHDFVAIASVAMSVAPRPVGKGAVRSGIKQA